MGNGRPWPDGLTIGAALHQVAERYPDNEALVFPRRQYRLDYAEYDAAVDGVAAGLLGLGIGRGDKVAIWSTNRPEWVLLQMASARVGAILVTVNPAFREEELRYVLRQSQARALFLTDRFKDSDYFARVSAVIPELSASRPGALASAAAPELRWIVSLPDRAAAGMLTWADVLERGHGHAGAIAERAGELGADDAINLQYTSGTTGFPKGALLSHRNLLLNGWYVGQCQRFGSRDRLCSPVPLYHCFGCVVGVVAAMVHGATLLVPAEHFDATATLECIESERATAVYGVPTMFIAMLEDPSFAGRDLGSLRTGVMAGAPCPVELMNRVIGDMGVAEITIGYGLTESSPVATQTRPDDPVRLRVESVGRAIPGVEVTIRDLVTGAELAEGQQGEICIRGHNVMIGYHGDPEATAEAIDADGWLHSGDLGERDAAGYIRITGRSKDMIIRGGENIYPREIEEALYRYAPVQEVEVVGVPDDRLGEEVCAWIRLRPEADATPQSVRDHCRGTVAHFKVPRYVAFAEAFPTTISGKVQKFRLRELALERLREGKLDDALRHSA